MHQRQMFVGSKEAGGFIRPHAHGGIAGASQEDTILFFNRQDVVGEEGVTGLHQSGSQPALAALIAREESYSAPPD